MGKVEKLLLIQPHSDDILFSCAHALLGEGYEVQVLTVENNAKRIQEDKNLYEFLNIPFHHLTVEFDDQSYYGYFKQFKTVNHENALNYLTEYWGEDKLTEISQALYAFIRKFQKINPDYKIVAPFGQSHPFHYFVHWLISAQANYFYREFPHSYKKRAKEQFENSLVDFELYKSIPTVEIHDIKFDLAKRFYKSQSGLLWFEQGYIKKMLPEEIYVNKTK